MAWLLDEWGNTLFIVHKFVMCEGHFDSLYIYNARILLNLQGSIPMNMPCFSYKP